MIWRGVFLRWVLDLRPQAAAAELITAVRETHASARSEVMRLRRTLQQLEEQAVRVGVLQA